MCLGVALRLGSSAETFLDGKGYPPVVIALDCFHWDILGRTAEFRKVILKAKLVLLFFLFLCDRVQCKSRVILAL